MNNIQYIMKIADIHAKRMNYAYDKLRNSFPLLAENLENISETDFLLIELLIGRFSKLQDLIGTKLVDAFLESKRELVNTMTMIDKMNKLEKLGIIDDASVWFEMRELCNHLAHEYPDHPEITTRYLNKVFLMIPQLLLFLKNIKDRI